MRTVGGPSRSAYTVRTRVVSAMLAFMAAGLLVTGGVSYFIQFRALDERVEQELVQELQELEFIAATRQESGLTQQETVDDLLEATTSSLAPSENESILAIVDGEPRYRPRVAAFELATPETLTQIEAAYQENRTVFADLEVEGREVRALIASVEVPGDDSEGIFVAAIDVGEQKAEIWRRVALYAAFSVVTVLIAGGLGYLISGRLLRPIGQLRAATENITVDDLVRRVDVPDTKDDVAALATNFNRMMERIDAGFAEQRRFTSDVGHELRTPLTIVRGTMEMTDPEDPDDVRESRVIAIDELDRMSGLVDDLSELAAATRPRYVMRRSIQMRDFAESAFARIQKIGERDWTLERAAAVTADADEQRLMQAVVQLAANAVRYSEGGSRIGLAVDRVLGTHGPEIHVSLVDEGIGIDPADQQRVFDRFSRLDSSRGTGSGLGLAIVRAIADGHGGEVRLHSVPGEGSIFTIAFPQTASTRAHGDEASSEASEEENGADVPGRAHRPPGEGGAETRTGTWVRTRFGTRLEPEEESPAWGRGSGANTGRAGEDDVAAAGRQDDVAAGDHQTAGAGEKRDGEEYGR